MKLVHRTNYWGDTINWNDRDDEVDMEAIWVQFYRRKKDQPCCPGFGIRRVGVTVENLAGKASIWTLFFVSGTEGTRNSDHYFNKLVLIPQGTKGYGREICKKKWGWKYKGLWDASDDDAKADLKELLDEYHTNDDHEVCHVHIGIHMETLDAGRGHSG